MISIDQIKQLREETDVSIIECKKALEKTEGDIEKAKEILRKWGQELAGKKSSRKTNQGIIESYIHPNKKIGVLIDIRCESDFVTLSDDFKTLTHDIALHIAGMKPSYVKPEDIPEEIICAEKEIYKEQIANSGKPEKIMEQMMEGKIKKYKEGISLLTQPFVKDPGKTVENIITGCVAKLGENIVVKKFIRYEI